MSSPPPPVSSVFQPSSLVNMQWEQLLYRARKGYNNTQFSFSKHHEAAAIKEKEVTAARWCTIAASAAAGGGSALTAFVPSSHPPITGILSKILRVGPVASAILSVGAAIVTGVYLAPSYVQGVVHHREAGVEYGKIHSEYDSFITNVCLDTSVSQKEIQAKLDALDAKKADIDTRFKDLQMSPNIYYKVKLNIHGPPPPKEPTESYEEHEARWTQIQRDKEKIIAHDTAQLIVNARGIE